MFDSLLNPLHTLIERWAAVERALAELRENPPLAPAQGLDVVFGPPEWPAVAEHPSLFVPLPGGADIFRQLAVATAVLAGAVCGLAAGDAGTANAAHAAAIFVQVYAVCEGEIVCGGQTGDCRTPESLTNRVQDLLATALAAAA